MNKIIAGLKNIRIQRIITTFVASVLLFITTACGGSKVLAKTADQIRPEVPSGAVTNTYKGGMNNYEDVDARQNTSAAQAKAKALVDNAKRNIDEKSVDSPQQYVENYRSGTPFGERVKRIGEDVGEAAENISKDVAKGTRKNAENAKGVAEETADAAQSKVKSDIATTKQAAREAGDAAKSKVSRDVGRAQRALDNAAEAVD